MRCSSEKIMKKEDEEQFVDMVIKLVKVNGMTIKNIEDCIELVKEYMNSNAVLENGDSERG